MEIYLSFHLFKTRITATLASSLPFCSQSVSPVACPLDKLASALLLQPSCLLPALLQQLSPNWFPSPQFPL